MKARTRMSPMRSLGLLTWLACAAAGCVTTQTSHRPKEAAAPAASTEVYQVQATWESRIVKTADITKNGAEILGLGGRMYLFGEQVGYPLMGDGAAIVELSDMAQLDPQGKPKLIERWEIDPATLKRLARKDMIGWGYTLFLPWNTYRPDLTKVQMQVRFVPTKGLPLFSPPSVVTLRDDTKVTVTHRQVVHGPVAQVGASLPALPPLPHVGQP